MQENNRLLTSLMANALPNSPVGTIGYAQAHRVGGIENFTERATPFLRKDIAAASEAAGEAGVDLGLLGMVVAAGPLDLRRT